MDLPHRKSGNIPVAASGRYYKNTLSYIVRDHLESQSGADEPLYPVHRLDRETSGIVVFGRTEQVRSSLSWAGGWQGGSCSWALFHHRVERRRQEGDDPGNFCSTSAQQPKVGRGKRPKYLRVVDLFWRRLPQDLIGSVVFNSNTPMGPAATYFFRGGGGRGTPRSVGGGCRVS